MQANRIPPVKVGQVLNLYIRNVGQKGDGVAKEKGYTIFVPEGQMGVTYTVKMTNVRETFGFAEILHVAEEQEEE